MRWLLVVGALCGCQDLWHVEHVGVPPDAAPDAPIDAPPDVLIPMCPATYVPVMGQTSLYRLSTESVQWRTAAAACAADETVHGPILGHTHLAVLDSAAEAHALYMTGNDRFVGLSDLQTTGTFRWVTMDPSALATGSGDTTLWSPNEPNMIGVEHCAHFDTGNADHVNNIDCTSVAPTPHPYLCECDAYPNEASTYP